MKVSVSLPEEDVVFLDEAVQRGDAPSRSAALHNAINLLRTVSLEDTYAAAFAEWGTSEDAESWESISGDGLTDAAR
ncbi:ribbon-helix-helix domain-containing protein [Sphaerisporangium perillae]|uniref:ribbon-helix-helix domain-containing protein n=1 Tax=Sphaerisporangium perillae TaxID=2935860 RepID=UPI00200BDD27|nr:ribbon-helix-helix domain-containing protein [Sphaerisporangium perillae]